MLRNQAARARMEVVKTRREPAPTAYRTMTDRA
jgi:hypothetical protein